MTLDDAASSDLFSLLCGEQLGRGCYRTVFQSQMDKGRVVKHDTRANWSNVAEYTMWAEFMGTPLARWLAPVFWLSPGGIWMIQAKTLPFKNRAQMPDKVPALFTDLKAENWGMYKGRPVCHDYANNKVYTLIDKNATRLVKAKWRD